MGCFWTTLWKFKKVFDFRPCSNQFSSLLHCSQCNLAQGCFASSPSSINLARRDGAPLVMLFIGHLATFAYAYWMRLRIRPLHCNPLQSISHVCLRFFSYANLFCFYASRCVLLELTCFTHGRASFDRCPLEVNMHPLPTQQLPESIFCRVYPVVPTGTRVLKWSCSLSPAVGS